MSFRLDQGHGYCTYRLGVEDNGCHSLLSYEIIAESARILECIARSLNAVVTERRIIQQEIAMGGDGKPILRPEQSAIVIHEPSVLGDSQGNKIVTPQMEEDALRVQKHAFTRAEITIHRVETHMLDLSPLSVAELASASSDGTLHKLTSNKDRDDGEEKKEEQPNVGETLSERNIRVAVVGNVDAGKSTLIGTLTTSSLDDGRGKSRTAIMKHRHEIESGRTSTVSSHLMGFRSTGESIAGRDQVRGAKRRSEDEIAREAYRIITLMDLAGHEKYLKTT